MPLDILKTVELSYDYSQIPLAERAVVRYAAMEIKPRLKRAAQDVYAVGEQLNAVKALIPHGQWTEWLSVEFELTDRTAQNFMAVADRFAGKTEIISDLPPTALYLLAAPSTPDAVVEDVTAKAAAGERVRVADVKKAITEAKQPDPFATVDDLTRHIGSWLSQQIGTPAESLTNAARRDTVTRRHLENFLGRREVLFAVRTLEEAIAEVMTNVVNTGAADTELRGPMPTMSHKDVADLKKAQAATPPPTDNTSLSVEAPTVERTASGLPAMGLVERAAQPERKPVTQSDPALFTSKSAEHYTPDEIIEAVLKVLQVIDLDPCSNSSETPNIPATAHFTINEDGLRQPWHGRVYMNPPYGDGIDPWIAKLVESFETGQIEEAIALVPARTDTRWWQRLRDCAICFVTGRLKFKGEDNQHSAPFPSAVVYLGRHRYAFGRAFAHIGDTYLRMMTEL